MGQGDKASFEPPIAVGHLQDMVDLDRKMRGEYNKRFVSSISLKIC
jgi:hypothetical protein